MKNRNTPLYLITGFLGSGKTTLLQRIIEYFNAKQKIAIIQNEFAPANFDGKELKRTSHAEFELLEINNGSVFCVCLLSGFIESLSTFANKHKPNIIFMEASGLSDPLSVGQIFNSPKLQNMVYLAGTMCVVDAVNYMKFDKLIPRIQHQIQIADIVLINKADLISQTQEISNKISRINPFATLLNTAYCNIPLNQVFSDNFQKPKKLFFPLTNSERPDVNSLVFRSSKPVVYEDVDKLVKELASCSIRMKGYVLLTNNTTLSVQTIGEEINSDTIPLTIKQTELIIIGHNVSMARTKEVYNKYVLD